MRRLVPYIKYLVDFQIVQFLPLSVSKINGPNALPEYVLCAKTSSANVRRR